ncbi:MAG TPA: cyclopropane-fatty-acyl-phospholipid synthase family protein [Solirubrobacterales bacterium]|nr:cyclopropane-fatty-acyl-phospholipid synthase family protein [Solirubrobacterales bacterium]
MPSRKEIGYSALDRALGLGLIPDPVLRLASRRAARSRTGHEERGGIEAQEERLREMIVRMGSGAIAERVDAANRQHYEIPSEFFELFLGPRRKYSSAFWRDPGQSLAEAEEEMLALTCHRAGVEDGMKILDLGCGWGSLSLWIAENFPNTEITAVSNSSSQKKTIDREVVRLGLRNVEVITADINGFDPGKDFDRIVSVEMFEHMRNWKELLRRISTWLKPEGRLFVHVFTHRRLAYGFAGTWASERFFTAGTMPSHDLLLFFQEHMELERRWAVSGHHYARTLAAWLKRLDENRAEALAVLETVYGRTEARRALGTWRLFLISTEQIWDWNGGGDWMVSHYLLAPRAV